MKPEQPYPQAPPERRDINGKSVAALVLGTVGLCSPVGIIGLFIGYSARKEVNATGQLGRPLATAGIVLGWISAAGFILIILFYIIAGAAIWAGSDGWGDNMN
ncbi:DUF4190 domain-containing protein [Salininema proteolyticum]|uniref:DUF4190 domain-containing protein n=1 Tax=Salininema proteolyticum TaxID=1607685 RepID=A0ABV8TV21_9ACTN